MCENTNSSIILRDFILFSQANKLDCNILNNIKQFTFEKTQIDLLKKILKPVLYKNFYVVYRNKLLEIYTELIKCMTPEIIKSNNRIYYDFILIQSEVTSTVFKCKMNYKNKMNDIVVKSYPIIYYTGSEGIEFGILDSLNKNHFNVPKLYPIFKSDHFNCHPMEKIEKSLLDILLKNKEGISLFYIKKLLESVVPILEYLHTTLKYLYIDFSPRNIGVNNFGNGDCVFYMFDFGEAEKFSDDTRPIRHTERYSSITGLENQNITIYDEFESLGYLLLDTRYGGYNSPLGLNPTIESKEKLLKEYRDNNKNDFFSIYFTTIMETENIYSDVLNILKNYDEDNFKKFKVRELKKILKDNDLSISGNKNELIERIIDNDIILV
jgi:hypothetical protein